MVGGYTVNREELRKKLIHALSSVQVFDVSAEGEQAIESEADNLLTLFDQYSNSRVKETRIDELMKIDFELEKHFSLGSMADLSHPAANYLDKYIKHRLAEVSYRHTRTK